MKIGFFDSGLGGLTVMKAVVKDMPQYDYEFFGDTAHLPYGDKSEEEIFEFTKSAVTILFERECLLVIIACNTASSETLRKLQDTFLPSMYPERKILGVIVPMVETALEVQAKSALLIGTRRTVDSKKYEKEFAKHKNSPELYSVATPTLVPLIENGEIEKAAEEALQIVSSFIERGVDTIILGCTHYGLLRDELEKKISTQVKVLAADIIIPKKIKLYLSMHPEIESQLSHTSKRNIDLSKHTPVYDKLLGDILGGYMIS